MSEQRKRQGKKKADVTIPAASSLLEMPHTYAELLESIKAQVQSARLKAVLSANAALVMLYWHIGQSILMRQSSEGWGAKVIDRLSFDLKQAFPDMQGFSPRNLKYMRAFAETYPEAEFVQRLVAQIPWKSNLTLVEKIKALVSQSVTPSENRKATRFPEQFLFQLTQTEIVQSVANCDRFTKLAKVQV